MIYTKENDAQGDQLSRNGPFCSWICISRGRRAILGLSVGVVGAISSELPLFPEHS